MLLNLNLLHKVSFGCILKAGKMGRVKNRVVAITGALIILLLGFYPAAAKSKLYLHSKLHSFADHESNNLTFSLLKYSKLRHFHHRVDPLVTIVVFCNEIAIALNASLSVPKFTNFFNNSKYPTILPFLNTWVDGRSTQYFWDEYTSNSTWQTGSIALPRFHQIDSLPQNFIYCQVPRQIHSSFFSLLWILVEPLDKWNWLALCSAFSLVTIFETVRNYVEIFKVQFSKSCLITFSGLLSPVSGNASTTTQVLKRSCVFVLWLLVATVVTSCYCGVMSRNIIRPLPDVRLNSVEDLIQANFSVLYSNQIWLDNDRRTAKVRNNTRFERLLKVARITDDYMRELCFGVGCTFLHVWPAALRIALLASERLAEQSEQMELSRELKKKCYVGRELIEAGPFFYGFLPPANQRVFRVFQRFFEGGIYRLWVHEYYGWMHSEKVQERTKVLGRTELIMDDKGVSGVPVIDLHSKMVVVFYIWGLGIFIALAVMAVEFLSLRRIC